MNLHTTNYFNAFILVAEDSPANSGEVPPVKDGQLTAANIQFEMVRKNPYRYTSDDVLFEVYAQKNDLTKTEYKAAREKFFSKGQACFRASPLTKRYGWGVHSNAEGKIALYGAETKEYAQFLKNRSLTIVKAMRSSRS
ncbi:DUF6157 family protein [Niabella drilacis]|uniref:Uncharacterized protein n=1 Tax=Niabella drilacis (strain DSM 25811 / CCM 8410 / CCUG 62505 / LMG 26954 / E90) TaxID=1285928 RepID=A0A1G6JTN2_NIADE|nr:DUF6157 family protein [Niabella drilacis]SDC22102.1 hypothetical protein SAMN04487894_101637 [Niabella drilacis]